VHARGQVAHVLTANPAPADRLRYALACRLPPDLTVVDVADVPFSFHATQHARGKLYRYTIFAARRPPALHGAAHRAWHVSFPLDLTAMRAAAARLVGRHDFAGFAKAPERRESTVRTISRIDVVKHFEEITIDVAGDGFLYNQIRIMVGSLMEIGRGHWPPERVGRILATRDRSLAGMTAPPQGLCLQWVRYPPWLEVAP
jgi:tRNA pseudouridine38-40 synthase